MPPPRPATTCSSTRPASSAPAPPSTASASPRAGRSPAPRSSTSASSENPSQPGQDARGCLGPAVGQHLAGIMESLQPTDVEIGSVVSLGFGINGERDIVTYNQHVAPKVFIPNHVTAVAAEGSSLEWKVGFQRVQDAMGVPKDQRPDLIWLVDPNDYLRPLVFDPKDARWRKPGHDR